MFRSTLALIAALLLGHTSASAATPPADEAPLHDRLEAAQKTINSLMDGQPSTTTETDIQVAQHWHNHHWNNWHNHWNNWANHWHNHHRH